ncbi:MAG TPA: tRNA (adenosine(37)-N6)-dimethylallyltransferase MiaA [Tissierellaceae bacterium]|nr:tRNA (adenosine(37)-N6)-dimethylallyltransferase MiaA [Tissierellaceae bacterium]
MKENLLVLMGPTAVGKTKVSINLAKTLNGEIISADSMQIYKYMNIGTAKITKLEMENIPHHLLDFINPDQEYTVSDYQRDASKHITEINEKDKLPIVVGGTGLYINSLVYKLNFARIPPNYLIRDKYESLADKHGNVYIHNKLKKIDEDSSHRIHINDKKRIIRALEIYELTGKTMSEYNESFRQKNNKYNLSMICLNMDRSRLYERINQRVDKMINMGLIEEVQNLLNLGYQKNSIALQGIGYKEIVDYLEGDINLDYAIEKIKQGSRNYAKRQLTWFRRDERIKWIDVDEFNQISDLSSYIKNYIKSQF